MSLASYLVFGTSYAWRKGTWMASHYLFAAFSSYIIGELVWHLIGQHVLTGTLIIEPASWYYPA